MLLHIIQDAALQARKARETDRATLLVTLYAEASRPGKDAGNRESSDEEVLRVVRKFIKGAEETLHVTKDESVRARAQLERSILETFLPVNVAGEDLRQVVRSHARRVREDKPQVPAAKLMGEVMAGVKAQLAGAFDGAEASAMVRQELGLG